MPAELLSSLTSEQVVTRSLLLRNAADFPERRFATYEDGSSWTHGDALIEAARSANALRGSGVCRGDRVAIILPNGPDFLRAWFGAALLGATIVPINPALTGTLLARPFALAQPSVTVVHPDYPGLSTLAEAELGGTVINPAALRHGPNAIPSLDGDIGLWEDEKLLLTSGTTGPSKLVRVPYLYGYWGYTTILLGENFGPGDVFQIDLPLFHTAALGYINAALSTGSAIYVRARPALHNYWEIARDAQVTGAILISSMVSMMMAQPARPSELEHRVRLLVMAPIPTDFDAFQRRFGVCTILTSCGSTEASTPIRGVARRGLDPSYCGEVVPGFEVRLVDENDQEVPAGQTGEAIIRCSRPFAMSSGYVQDVAATAQAWRHGWFHTGDLLRQDANGRMHFVGRNKDVIRRRGENISAYEVELALAGHDAVDEVACVPVPSDTGIEDEVKVFVVCKKGAIGEPVELMTHAYAPLAHHMVPRYFEFVDAIPKTNTGKPQKYLLCSQGNTDATWDREAHGFRVTRRGIERQVSDPCQCQTSWAPTFSIPQPTKDNCEPNHA